MYTVSEKGFFFLLFGKQKTCFLCYLLLNIKKNKLNIKMNAIYLLYPNIL